MADENPAMLFLLIDTPYPDPIRIVLPGTGSFAHGKYLESLVHKKNSSIGLNCELRPIHQYKYRVLLTKGDPKSCIMRDDIT
jgi:hypothetical protein